jgi:hypothetical protein
MLGALSGASVTLESAVFLYVGALGVREISDGASAQGYGEDSHSPIAATEPSGSTPLRLWNAINFIVAINLCNLAVYLMYIAWHDNSKWWEMTDDEYAEYCMTPIDNEWFKPQHNSHWACLPGFEDGVSAYTHRRVVAKLEDNVHEWKLGHSSTPFAVGPVILPPDSVPFLEEVRSVI